MSTTIILLIFRIYVDFYFNLYFHYLFNIVFFSILLTSITFVLLLEILSSLNKLIIISEIEVVIFFFILSNTSDLDDLLFKFYKYFFKEFTFFLTLLFNDILIFNFISSSFF